MEMSLSSVPIDNIDYDLIDEFISQKNKEDIDLDYKLDFPKDLGNLLCAFANTQGGIVLIGVDEEGKSRKPVYPPKGVDIDPDVARQRILNIAFDAIYPPIEPEVVVCQMDKSNRYLIIIRVEPSTLLHAVDHRKRIYIRSVDNNRGYALANLSDLRWLWERRESSIKLRDSLVEKAKYRSSSQAIKYYDIEGKNFWKTYPHLRFYIVPTFPHKEFVSSTNEMLDVVRGIDRIQSAWTNVDRNIPWDVNQWRTIRGGVCLRDRGGKYDGQYLEVGQYGQLYFDFQLRQASTNTLKYYELENESFIEAYIILAYIDLSLRFAEKFFSVIKTRGPILLSCEITNIASMHLHYIPPTKIESFMYRYISQPSIDEYILLYHDEINSQSLGTQIHDLLIDMSKSLLWAFGVGWTVSDINKWLGHIIGK